MKIIHLKHLDHANLKTIPKHHMNRGESKVFNHQLALATRERRRDEVPRLLLQEHSKICSKTPSKVAPDLVPKLHKSLQAKRDRKEAKREEKRIFISTIQTLGLISTTKSKQLIFHPWMYLIQPKRRENPKHTRRNPIKTQITNPNRHRNPTGNVLVSRLVAPSVD